MHGEASDGELIDLPVVTHAVLSLDCGGLEHVVLDLIRHGRSRTRRVSIVCLERPGALATKSEKLGVNVACVAKRPGIRLGVTNRVTDVLKSIDPDILHTHQIGVLFYAGPAARRLGIPIVHTEHGKHYASRMRTRWLGRIASRYADRFCCVSRDIADEVIACRVAPQRKVHVVPNGIDFDRFAMAGRTGDVRRNFAIPDNAVVIGTVGRLSEIKRQDRLIRAVTRLGVGSAPSPHLMLVGDGALMGELKELAASLGVADRVHFAGYQSDPAPFLAAMDVFALTSRSEGMPLAILEAWAAGKPVVASRVGGIPEIVEHGVTGLMFEADDEGALVAALGGLLADRPRARALGEAGRRIVEARYSLRSLAETYHRHYVEVIEAAGRRSSAPPIS